MLATIDIGSNTVRMLIGSSADGVLLPSVYQRRITRLGGGFSPTRGLSPVAMARTIATLKDFSAALEGHQAQLLRAVGTAALRRAVNRREFIEQVLQQTGIRIDVIEGDEEARLTTLGALSVISPQPENVVIFDIGGGSTEVVCIHGGRICAQQSFPLGVVRLAEEYSDHERRQHAIETTLMDYCSNLRHTFSSSEPPELIGTAGTMTTLAAIDLKLTSYNPSVINNHVLSVEWMASLYAQLETLSTPEREQWTGMEQGRGDLILPGLQLASTIAKSFEITQLKVADAGLLEGTFLDACRD
ncbi:rod shape-determining protein [Pelovirga terrestris]|uniref:Rod shape-determining protein n=1 Tax=Pelovirga terrestris TaxID=2771352 RepID=A0A8J6UNC7_9BACT|nr:rod shape-determining protein [Pelovirga terrestris]MBD1399284.1 rod shape-determining protein [Pelovirga terrestris]